MNLPIAKEQLLRIQAEQAKGEEQRKRREEISSAIIVRIHKARQDCEDAALRMHEAASELRDISRRNFDESSGAYINFASAHLRLAGAMVQGSKRTASMDRLLKNARREQEEARVREEDHRRQQEVRAHEKLVHNLGLPSDDAFDELYGEIVTDA